VAIASRRLAGPAAATRERRPAARTVRGRNPRLRVLGIGLVIAVVAASVWTRLAYWQLVEHSKLSQYASLQYAHAVPLPAPRGVIYDRNMQPLAVNTTVYSVFVSPDAVPIPDRERVAAGLAQVLGVDPVQVAGTLKSSKKFAYIARRQPKAKADQITALALPGVGMETEQQRSYLPGGAPGSSLASNLLGYVDFDGQGQYGIEGYYDAKLAGKAGFKSTYRDAAGRDIVLGPSQHVSPVSGSDLVLSIDAGIQYAAEQALAKGVQANKAQNGSVIVMDPKTGAILAWADYPTYDANQFAQADPGNIKDSIVSDLYEPGSIMKVPTLSGALQNQAITPTTTINDPGYINVGGSTLHDWDLKNHGTVTMTRVLEESYNVGAVRAEQMEGLPAFYQNLQAFGFNAATGVDVAGEVVANPPLRPYEQWRENELATAAYGQGIAVNMVQVAGAINVIANGGRYAPPHAVAQISGKANPVEAQPQRQVIAPATAATMKQMMESVVQHGSGYTARVPGFETDEAGKTGTSQMPEAGGYSMDHVWASYAGFLPADNPRFSMLVVIRKPNNGSFDHNEGYYVSAPIWKEIAQSIILQWRVVPDPGH
jgi:cell division protein FtsI (penicillin-binding protein 3)